MDSDIKLHQSTLKKLNQLIPTYREDELTFLKFTIIWTKALENYARGMDFDSFCINNHFIVSSLPEHVCILRDFEIALDDKQYFYQLLGDLRSTLFNKYPGDHSLLVYLATFRNKT